MVSAQFMAARLAAFRVRADAHAQVAAVEEEVVEEVNAHLPEEVAAVGATYRSCGSDDTGSEASASSKRSRVEMSPLEQAVRALKVAPPTDAIKKALYTTVEKLVVSIGSVRETLTTEELDSLGELDEAVGDESQDEWIGHIVGCAALSNLKKINAAISKPVAFNAGGDCVICLETIPDDGAATTTPCGHVMHSDCLTQWLAVAPAPRCPICVGPLSRPAGIPGRHAQEEGDDTPRYISLNGEGAQPRYNSLAATYEDDELPAAAYRSIGA